MLGRLRRFLRRRKFRVGARLTRWLVPDVKREIEVVDASELDAGFVTVRARTLNVLYTNKGLAAEPPFGEPKRVALEDLWQWRGAPWGGPVPVDD